MPNHRTDPLHARIEDLSRALDSHPRLAGLVFRGERWQVAASIWEITALPPHRHAHELLDLSSTLAPHDPTFFDAVCAAYRRAMLRWGGTERHRQAG